MGGIRDILADICLFGAAASFAAYLALANARHIARVSDALAKIPRAHLAAFLAFALVATLCAQNAHGVVVEYAMSRTMSPVMVAQYKQQFIPKEVLQRTFEEYLALPETIEA